MEASNSTSIIKDTFHKCYDNAQKYVSGPFANFIGSFKAQMPFAEFRKVCKDSAATKDQKIAAFIKDSAMFTAQAVFATAITFTAIQLFHSALAASIVTVACVALYGLSQNEEIVKSASTKIREFLDAISSSAVKKKAEKEAPAPVEKKVEEAPEGKKVVVVASSKTDEILKKMTQQEVMDSFSQGVSAEKAEEILKRPATVVEVSGAKPLSEMTTAEVLKTF